MRSRPMDRLRADAVTESWCERYLVADQGTLVDLPGWRGRSECAGLGPAWWGIHERTARVTCAGCPVRASCLQDARRADDEMPVHHITGVAAGLTGPARQRLQRRLRAGAAA